MLHFSNALILITIIMVIRVKKHVKPYDARASNTSYCHSKYMYLLQFESIT